MFTPRPSLDEVLAVRRERQPTVRHVMASLADEQLASEMPPAELHPSGYNTRNPRPGPTRRPTLQDATDDWGHRCCVNGFVNETRRNCRDGVRRGVMARRTIKS